MNFMKYNFVSNDFTIILITRRELSVSLEYSFRFIIILVDNFKLSNLREAAAAISRSVRYVRLQLPRFIASHINLIILLLYFRARRVIFPIIWKVLCSDWYKLKQIILLILNIGERELSVSD